MHRRGPRCRLCERRDGPIDHRVGADAHKSAQAAGLAANVVVSAEPGRAIVAAAAITCYSVGTIKALPGLRT